MNRIAIILSIVCFCFGYTRAVSYDYSDAFGSDMDVTEYPIGNITVLKGKDAVFTCVVENLGGHRVAWMKFETKAVLCLQHHVMSSDGKYSVVINDMKTFTFKIHNVQWRDRGGYICQINTIPAKSMVGFLRVIIPPDFIDEETDGSFSIVEGHSKTVKCKATGNPKPRIEWKREDGVGILVVLPHSESKITARSIMGEKLHLHKLQRSEMGSYLCIASNGVPPPISKRIMVYVTFKPEVNVPNQLIGAPVGTIVDLECEVECYPCPVMFWSKNDAVVDVASVQSNSRFKTYLDKSTDYSMTMVLTITNISDYDFGEYKCMVRNSLGESAGNIRLYKMEVIEDKTVKENPEYTNLEETTTDSNVENLENMYDGNSTAVGKKIQKASAPSIIMSTVATVVTIMICFNGIFDV